ncbi:MAG: hypothetical protein ABI672_08640 [Vicinamibacteria bacterium]
MRSPRTRSPWIWLLDKEWRELMASRAFWVMLLLTGPLVGVSFIGAVNTYADLSGQNGASAGVGEAFSPLIGIWAPTFSAFEIVAAFLLPFVAIRLVAADGQTGALKLEMQQPMSSRVRLAAKAAVLFGGWLLASSAALAAVGLWMSYGGHVHGPELAAVALGHFLNAGLTIALAAAAASIAEHPATAAILTLAFTVGTWVVSFVAAIHGGVWERLAGYTPPVMVAAFQHGLVRGDVVIISACFVGAGFGWASVWMEIGRSVGQRVARSVGVSCVTAAIVCAAVFVRSNWDLSENRYNSFSEAEEQALRRIDTPLRIQIHLAPEDPRRSDLERNSLSKLRRILPNLRTEYVSTTSTGLFEQTTDHYGELWYDLGGAEVKNRETTAEGVLETIFGLAGVTPEGETGPVFRGHPLVSSPNGAAAFFYIGWPALVACAAFLVFRRPS